MATDMDMKNFVLHLLQSRLPALYTYHNIEHTLYVTEKAVEIAQHEKCTDKEISLLRTAALWHDAGCIVMYKGHEEISCGMARQYLPGFKFSDSDIEIICGIIMATKIPQAPKTKLGEILADADLEYLGTGKAADLAEELYREMLHLHPVITKEQWRHTQISFLLKHHYFTAWCIKNREPGKRNYLNSLVNGVK
jgi:uncharacterized protein